MLVFKGKTAKFYLRSVRNVHGPVRGRYKLMWPEFRSQYLSKIRSASGENEAELMAAKFVATLMTEWNVTYPDDYPDVSLRGKPVPITAETLLNECFQPTYVRLVNVVTGMAECDVDPDDSVDDQLKTASKQSKDADELLRMLAEADNEKVGN
jgi:hypothetical protein